MRLAEEGKRGEFRGEHGASRPVCRGANKRRIEAEPRLAAERGRERESASAVFGDLEAEERNLSVHREGVLLGRRLRRGQDGKESVRGGRAEQG